MVENTTPEAEGTLVTPATETTELPKYDFGEGELASKVSALKDALRKEGILPEPPADSTGGIGEPVPGEQSSQPEKSGEPITGADVDWSEFDVPVHLAHLYPKSQVIMTEQGPVWAVMLDEFLTREKNVNPGVDPAKRNEKTRECQYMGQYVTEMLSAAPESGCTEWRLVAFMPGSISGMAQVIFQRKKQVGLPDPAPLPKPTDEVTPAPTDPELTDVEAKAANWAGEPAPETPYTSADEPTTDGAVEGA